MLNTDQFSNKYNNLLNNNNHRSKYNIHKLFNNSPNRKFNKFSNN